MADADAPGTPRDPAAPAPPEASSPPTAEDELDLEEDIDADGDTGAPRGDGAGSVAPGSVAPGPVAAGPRRLPVPAGEIVRRVDRFVADRTGLSRSYVQKLIADGRLTDDEGRRLRANSEVRAGSVTLEIPPPEVPYHLEPDPDIEVRVVYEDDDLLIVDKPAGLVVHPAPGHWRGTLVNGLLARDDHYGGIAGVARPGIVHRLDRDTSGLLIVARNDAAQASLMAQLKARRVRKTYLALVQGTPAATVGRVEAPIGRDPRDRKRMAVVPDGRRAVTGYRVRERFAGWTLLELDLVTGRTHQIRVHLAALGHPVAGDAVYGTGTARRGPDGLTRLFLHAWRLELVTPVTARLIRAEAPLPPELDTVLELLRAVEISAGRRPAEAGR
jgi:23S rRNA pseudouridine1911/1915/1917 synthase